MFIRSRDFELAANKMSRSAIHRVQSRCKSQVSSNTRLTSERSEGTLGTRWRQNTDFSFLFVFFCVFLMNLIGTRWSVRPTSYPFSKHKLLNVMFAWRPQQRRTQRVLMSAVNCVVWACEKGTEQRCLSQRQTGSLEFQTFRIFPQQLTNPIIEHSHYLCADLIIACLSLDLTVKVLSYFNEYLIPPEIIVRSPRILRRFVSHNCQKYI